MVWLRSRWDWIVRNKFLTCIIVFAVGLLVFGVVMVCRHWGWIVTESGSTIIRNLGLVIGGLIAIGFGIWRGVVADRQAKASQDQAETSQRGLLNERYQKGTEMLGSEVLSVRLGGIYALHRLAEDEPEKYHVQIMQLFCAFVRHPTKDEDEDKGKEGTERVREDVETAVLKIGTRSDGDVELEKAEDYWLNLSEAHLACVVLKDTNLTGAVLHHTDLFAAYVGGANFSGVEGLTQAQLHKMRAPAQNPPKLDNAYDVETGAALEWRGFVPDK